MEIYGRIQPELTECELKSSFEELRKEYSDPWAMASFLKKEANGERFTEILCELLYRRTTQKKQKLKPIGADQYKRLPMAYLANAETLNSAIAFCSALRAIRTHPCYELNPKVQAVLTLNYDGFLEAGGTQKHNAGRFKPRVSLKILEKLSKLPVYHIHGYIPYGGRTPERELVLTEESYKKAYENDGLAQEILKKLLHEFSALFIGISFDDKRLLQCLKDLAAEKNPRNHFALIKKGCSPHLLKQLEGARVFPIIFSNYEQIPTILGYIYKKGLRHPLKAVMESEVEGKVEKVGEIKLSKDEYWALLLFNKE
jgi:hypothetical protein